MCIRLCTMNCCTFFLLGLKKQNKTKTLSCLCLFESVFFFFFFSKSNYAYKYVSFGQINQFTAYLIRTQKYIIFMVLLNEKGLYKPITKKSPTSKSFCNKMTRRKSFYEMKSRKRRVREHPDYMPHFLVQKVVGTICSKSHYIYSSNCIHPSTPGSNTWQTTSEVVLLGHIIYISMSTSQLYILSWPYMVYIYIYILKKA